MNSALVSEPIVQIFSNLYPHVKPDGVCLPTGISVLASPVATTSFHDPHELVKSYGRPMEVVRTNWQQVADYTPGDRLEQIRAVFHADQLPRGGTMLALASEVRLLGGRVIGLYDSAITKPVYATKGILEGPWEVNSSKVEGVSVSYAPGQLISDAEVRIALKY